MKNCLDCDHCKVIIPLTIHSNVMKRKFLWKEGRVGCKKGHWRTTQEGVKTVPYFSNYQWIGEKKRRDLSVLGNANRCLGFLNSK